MPLAKKKSARPTSGGRQTLRARFSTINNGIAHSIQEGLDIPYDPLVHEEKMRILNCRSMCAYCLLRPGTSTDHYSASICEGMPSEFTSCSANTIPCCEECNKSKGNKSLGEWRPEIACQERFQEFDSFHKKHAWRFTYDAQKVEGYKELLRKVVYNFHELFKKTGTAIPPPYLRGPPTEDIDAP